MSNPLYPIAGPRPPRRRAVVLLSMLAIGGWLVAACSSAPTTKTGGSTAVVPSAPSTTVLGTAPKGTVPPNAKTTTFHVVLTSQDKRLHSVGTDDSKTYGWNLLVGTTTIEGQEAQFELQGSVDYTGGSGPWGSFVTITWPDGTLGFRVAGDAAFDAASKNTSFTGEMEVIGGTGRFLGAAGTATVVGTRSDALGGQVDFDVTMVLRGVSS